MTIPAPATEGDSTLETADAIVVRDLLVRRGQKVVLPGVSIRVRAGMVTGLLGPSGCGKSTLMRAIVGVQIVERGEVSVLGLPAGTAELRHRVGYVTQTPSVYPDLTVDENLAYFARVLNVPDARIAASIEAVGLAGQRDQLVETLSGGERSRASLAVALLSEPQVLVLDEPTIGLDPILRADLWRTFHDLAAGGTALLVSTHVMDEAERCDDLVLMREGRIVASGSPVALLAQAGASTIEEAFIALAVAP